jgi:hypothetical protein
MAWRIRIRENTALRMTRDCGTILILGGTVASALRQSSCLEDVVWHGAAAIQSFSATSLRRSDFFKTVFPL